MKNVAKRKIALITLLSLFLIGIVAITLSANLSVNTIDIKAEDNTKTKAKIKNEEETQRVKYSGFWNLGSKIEIDDTDPSKNWTYTEQNYGWCNLVDGVYVIENVTIDRGGASDIGLKVSNSNKTFIINNCTILDADEGIRFQNVNNSIVSNNFIISNHYDGITIHSSYNNTIERNFIKDNGKTGIWVNKGENNTFSGNTITKHTENGIEINDSHNNTIKLNKINETTGNSGVGIAIVGGSPLYSNNNTVIRNTITLNDFGVFISQANGTIFKKNSVNYNTGYGMWLQFSQFCSIIDNIVNHNQEGLRFRYNSWCLISDNEANYNEIYGINLMTEAHNNTIRWNNFNESGVQEIYVSGDCIGNIIIDNAINGYWVLDYAIYIDGDATGPTAHNWNWAEKYGWCDGAGTFNDPYIIKNIVLDAEGKYCSIKINDSSDYFIIEGCKISNHSEVYELYLRNIANGKLINNFLNNHSLQVGYSENITIENNLINGAGVGLFIYYLDNTSIRFNRITNSIYDGCRIIGDMNNTIIEGNIFSDNGDDGLRIFNGDFLNITIIKNIFSSNGRSGLYIIDTIDARIEGNDFIKNLGIGGFFVIYLYSIKNCTYSGNIIKENNVNIITVWNCDNISITENLLIQAFVMDAGSNSRFTIKNNQKSVYWTYEPIVIDETGNDGYTWNEARLKFWCRGFGKNNDPYIVNNGTIDGDNIFNCIEIKNSDINFIIENCTFTNSGNGIYTGGIKLDHVSNGMLINNNCSLNNFHGIFISFSNYTSVFGNIATKNLGNGLCINWSNNNTISGNAFSNNDKSGIALYYSYNNTISDNDDTIINNGLYGMYLEKSDNNTITNNVINYNPIGIYLNDSNWNHIIGNDLRYNILFPIFEENCYYNERIGNLLSDGGLPAGKGDDDGGNGEKTTDFTLLLILILVFIGTGLVISMVIIKKKAKKSKEIDIIEVEEIFCPYCQNMITRGTRTCFYCGMNLEQY